MRHKGEKVLITGASGFIGSHLTEALLRKNYRVICLQSPKCDTRWIKSLNVEFINGDITDKDSLYKAVSGASYIYHLAALLNGYCPEADYQ